MAVAVGKLWHWVWGVLTLITMVLIYHETKAPHFVWLSIIASLALVRVLPTQGWFSRSVRFYRNLSLITLLIIALPFMMQQVRQSIYPQLERPWATLEQPSYAPPTMISQSLRRPFLADQVQQAMEPLPHKSRYQTGSFSYAGKVRSKLVQIDLNVMFLAILIAFFLWVSWGPGANNLKTLPITKKKTFTKRKSKFNEKCPSKAIQSVALLLVSLLLCLPTYAQEPIAPQQVDKPVQVDKQVTNKSSFPPQSLLDELQNRLLSEHHLLTQPECLPYCASSPRLFLELSTQQLSARMEIHSHADVVVPLPGIAKQWLPQQVLLNGEPASNLWRDKKGQLWIKLIKGIHQIQMTGSLPNRHTVQLPLPLKPHFVTVKAEEWDIEGVHENGVADAQLQFTRLASNESRDTQNPIRFGNRFRNSPTSGRSRHQ